ncbi:MAG: hypothetical protein KatS3mg032_1399 [Cyclobacteriaceae bacterium]|nr:MAG: hypothetical protein KatS3mg032_1399 [Cyclobacteriaceae bacterium]
MNTNYQLGLLYLVHLLVGVDGQIDDREQKAINTLRRSENIDDALYHRFAAEAAQKSEREIYHSGIEYMNNCTDQERLRAFAILYRLSEADGRIHVKEVRLLLYSIKASGVEFNDVVKEAEKVNIF